MTPEFAEAARSLLFVQGETASSRHVAERAAEACESFTQHLARLVGELGVDTLLRRSVTVASAEFPWLRAGPASTAVGGLRESLERQDPESATHAFITVLSTFIGLLKRLIGEGLVEGLLHEVWPDVFGLPQRRPSE